MTITQPAIIKKQLLRFIVVGCTAVATDFISYIALLHFLPPTSAKTASFICGTFVAYILNKYWTFEKKGRNHKEMFLFFILYGLTLSANVLVNHLILTSTDLVLLAFLCATGISTILNFIGQKWFVFKI